jgi:hypothetical protein
MQSMCRGQEEEEGSWTTQSVRRRWMEEERALGTGVRILVSDGLRMPAMTDRRLRIVS